MNKRILLSLLLLLPTTSILSMKKEITKKTEKSLFKRGAGFWTSPNDETKKGFFNKLTPPKSQREDWYAVTPYIAEFWCTFSNAGFIYAGLQHGSPELLFAGTASIISHSIPKKWLLAVDKLGVAVVASKVIRNYKTLINNPWLVAPVALAGTINAIDAYLARNKGKTWPHVVWHLSSAALASVFLSYTK